MKKIMFGILLITSFFVKTTYAGCSEDIADISTKLTTYTRISNENAQSAVQLLSQAISLCNEGNESEASIKIIEINNLIGN